MSAPPIQAARVLHLDLDEPLPDLPAGRGAFIVLWYRGVPLGKLDLDVSQLPRSSTQLLDLVAPAVTDAVFGHLFAPEREAQLPPGPADLDALLADDLLSRLGETLTLPPGVGDTVSVVLCARDRPDQLRRCLTSLAAQQFSPLEIVVVHNAPTSEATLHVVGEHPGVRHVVEPRPGLHAARNTGVRTSRGDIVAFIDDDVLAHRDWVGRLGAAFGNRTVAAVTGQVLPVELETEEQVLSERWWSLGRGCAPLVYGPGFFEATRSGGVPVWEVGSGANMAFRRGVFSEVGPFDERLGQGTAGRGGESEIWYRLLAHGHRIRYEPAAVVHHHHPGDDAGFRGQIRDHASSHTAALLVQWQRTSHLGNLRRLRVDLPTRHLRLAVERALAGPTPVSSTLREEFAGSVRGVRHYLSNRKGVSHHG